MNEFEKKIIKKIPDGWNFLPIKKIVEIPVTDGPHETPEFLDEGIPFVSAESIRDWKIDFNKKRGFISEEDHKRYSLKYHPKRDDIYLIKSGATTGNMAIVETDEEFNIWSPLAVIRVDKEKMNPRFVLHSMGSSIYKTFVEQFWSFGTQQNIGMNVIENLSIFIPPLDTQKQIADFLDKETTRIDTLISRKQKQIELLQEKRQAIITQSVTRGLNPDVKMKDSGVQWIGEIPEHWDIVPLKRLLKVKDGTHDTPESITENETSRPLVTSKNVIDGKVDIENANHISYEDYLKVIKRSDATKDDVIMPMIGTIGNPCILDVDGYLAVKNIAIFKTSESIVPSRFMKYLLESNFITTQFGLLSRGGVQDFVSLTVLNNILVPMMSQDEYIKITDYLRDQSSDLNTLMEKIRKSIDLLKEYRSSLITHAVSGQIDLTEFTKDTGGF